MTEDEGLKLFQVATGKKVIPLSPTTNMTLKSLISIGSYKISLNATPPPSTPPRWRMRR
jgi:hypothetical protein